MKSKENDFYKIYNDKVDNIENQNIKSTGDISYKNKTEKSEKKENIKIHKGKILNYNKNIKEKKNMLKKDWFILGNKKENEINEQEEQNESDIEDINNNLGYYSECLEELQFNDKNSEVRDIDVPLHSLSEKLYDSDLKNINNIMENNEARESYRIQNNSEINIMSNDTFLVYPTKILIVG